MFGEKRKPLCKAKENCEQYKAGNDCRYSHELCRFGNRCNKPECLFTHNNNNQPGSQPTSTPKFSCPKNEVLCRDGMNCKAFPMGKCGFKHDENGQSNMNKFGPKRIEKDIMCKDGDNCTFNKRGICKFKHISNDKQIEHNQGNPLTMFPTHKQNHQDMPANRNKQGQVQGQSESELSTSQYSKSQQARRQFQPPSRPPNQPLLSLCLAYITNSCPNDESTCNYKHELSEPATIKRVFHSSSTPITNCTLYCHHSNHPSYNNDEPIYLINHGQEINFYRLLSSDKLLTQLPHKPEYILEALCDKSLTLNNHVEQLLTICNPTRELIILVMTDNLIFYMPLLGCYQRISKSPGIIHIVELHHTLIISQEGVGLRIFNLNEVDSMFIEIPHEQSDIEKQYKVFKKSKERLFGEYVIVAAGENGLMCCYNEHMDIHKLTIEHNHPEIVDCEFMVYRNQPWCIIIAKDCLVGNGYILVVNLLNFVVQVVSNILVRNDQWFEHVLVTHEHCLIQVQNLGVLVYKLGDFGTVIGMVSASNSIRQIDCDNRGNLIILEDNGNLETTLSIYKIKKH